MYSIQERTECTILCMLGFTYYLPATQPQKQAKLDVTGFFLTVHESDDGNNAKLCYIHSSVLPSIVNNSLFISKAQVKPNKQCMNFRQVLFFFLLGTHINMIIFSLGIHGYYI